MFKNPTPMRLFVDVRALAGPQVSGIGHSLVETIRALEREKVRGADIAIVLIVPLRKMKFIDKWGFKNVQIKRVPIPMRIINRLEKYRLLPPMDIFMGRGVYIFPNYSNWPLLNSRSLTYIYDISFLLYPEFVNPKNKQYLTNNINRWIKRTDRILTISQNAKAEISKHLHVPESIISIIPCGVDMHTFKPQPDKEVARVRKKYGLKGDYILYVGNIEPRKNLVRLIKAYCKVYDKHQKLSLLLVGGDGWQNEEIKREIIDSQKAGYPVIKPSEYVPDADLPALYTGAMMLVHPALYEGFGISPLQAMACATPVIVANNSSMPEVVGKAGLYVNATDTDDIIGKIEDLRTNSKLRKKLSNDGISRAKKFSWQQSVNDLQKAINAAVKS
jgi:glycosyltransferase involved in cell wall biosynthesis